MMPIALLRLREVSAQTLKIASSLVLPVAVSFGAATKIYSSIQLLAKKEITRKQHILLLFASMAQGARRRGQKILMISTI